MKVKLLKKIRKRFSYYFRKDGTLVLVDHHKKRPIIYDLANVLAMRNMTPEDFTKQVHIPEQQWLWRMLKDDMLKPFGYTYLDIMYRYGVRVSKHKTKRRFYAGV
jgi:hypothetical protein